MHRQYLLRTVDFHDLACMFPAELQSIEQLAVTHEERTYRIPLCRPTFAKATDVECVDSFGGKDLLLVDGRPQFAEVAILRAFEADGWQGRWVETYQRGAMTPALLRAWNGGAFKTQTDVPIEEAWVNDKLHAIAVANGNTFSGCWDVVAWKDQRLAFTESKKQKKDRLRGTQLRWLEAALRCGCTVEDFLVVEWSPV